MYLQKKPYRIEESICALAIGTLAFAVADFLYPNAVFKIKIDVSELQFEELYPNLLYTERKLNSVGFDLHPIDYK